MKIFFYLLLILSSFLYAEQKYSKVRIPIYSSSELNHLISLGIGIDHFGGKVGSAIEIFVNEDDVKILNENLIPYSTVIPDWKKYYQEQQAQETSIRLFKSADAPKYFRYGAMGGFLTNDEVLQQLDSMNLLFPFITTVKESIGVTNEGRKIFAIKISDQSKIYKDKPEVLYTALHHAREPEGMMAVIYYMWWLLENYGKDPEATYLVDNRQLWFIPVVNVDGYVYNQTTNPTGGGMWRKNRRANVGGTFGVDLNRNYGPDYMWNSSNNGSSTSPSNDTYRGTAPFSEPETQTMSAFLRKHQFSTCLNYHTYGNYLVFPWGYASKESPDSNIYRDWTYEMSMVNRYTEGTDMQTVNYSTRGNSDDFMYGDTSNGKARTFAMTPEVGTTGFWPTKAEIFPLAVENLQQNKLLAHYAGSYPVVRSYSSTDSANRKKYSIKVFNKGLSSGNYTLFLSTNAGVIQSYVYTGEIAPGKEKDVSFIFIVGNPSSLGKINFVFKDFSTTNFAFKDSIKVSGGTPTVLFSDSANSTSQWTTGTGWGLTTNANTPPTAFTDSPNGNYLANADNSLTMKNFVDLTNYVDGPTYSYVELRYFTKWAVEATWDFATVEISTNNGASWTTLRSALSQKGSGRVTEGSKQPSNSFGYDGYGPYMQYVEQHIDLSAYIGKQIKIRFRLSADNAEQRDGFYVDDIQIVGYGENPQSIQKDIIPQTFALFQNYPNPFNPETNISYQIPTESFVSLKVYDVLGREVSTLSNEEQIAGFHTLKFNASSIASGIYLYKIKAGTYSKVKTLTVIK